MADPEDVVRQFLTLLALPDTAAAAELLHEDVEWRNSRMPTMRGKGRVGGMLREMERRRIGFRVELHHVAADGEMVLTDRTDVLGFGRFETAFWVGGTFEVRNGLIVLWDDHFSWGALAGGSLKGLFRALTVR